MKTQLAKSKINWTPIIITILIFAGIGAAGFIGYTVYMNNRVDDPPYVNPILGNELTLVHNGEKNWNVPIDLYAKDLYDPDYSVIAGLRIYIYAYGSAPAQMAAKGLTIQEAVLLDNFATDSAGKGRSNSNFVGGTKLTAVYGLDSSANKSMLKDFVVQGLAQNTQPPSIDCGTLFYKKMAEESACTWSWTDSEGATITTFNYTTDSDKVLNARIKLVMSTSGQSLRDMWSRVYGDLRLMVAVKVTHSTSTSSAAIDIESSYDKKGTPSNQLVFAFYLEEIIYEVDSLGGIEEDHESFRLFAVKLDFSGCGFGAVGATQFTIGGWCLVEQTIDQVPDAGLPSGDSSDWFQDALASLTITT